MVDVRKTYAWQLLRARVIARAKNLDEPCGCGLPIDWDAPPRSRWSPSVDHIHSIKHGGPPLDMHNLRVAHFGCNSRRGAGRRYGNDATYNAPKTSRMW